MPAVDPIARNETLKALMHTLYHRTKLRHTEELEGIIRHNSTLHGNSQNEMSFRGMFYHYGAKVRQKTPVNLLRRELRDTFKQWLSKKENLEAECNHVRAFFQKVFMQSDRIGDLYELIPDQLHGALRNTSQCFVQTGRKLSDAEVAAFRTGNQKYMDLVTKRMTYNLLEVSHV